MAYHPKHTKSTSNHSKASTFEATPSSQPPPLPTPHSDDCFFKWNSSHPSLERQFNKDFAKRDVKPGQACKKIVNDPKFAGDEDHENTFAKPSVIPSAAPRVGPSAHPSIGRSYPFMSTTFDNGQAYSRLLSFMESMDACVVHRLDALEAQNRKLLYRQQLLKEQFTTFCAQFPLLA
ncbi:Uncharacterized protein TCM_035517 [Theobroma cacao]|uniref:Uncharacterized protein n=1 Tax=Theobroma cacao TaxID=3641 RepID=A0A061FQB2_THECC|nr:Uncharacterized protein TCM_035517 [Theobroma cacao]